MPTEIGWARRLRLDSATDESAEESADAVPPVAERAKSPTRRTALDAGYPSYLAMAALLTLVTAGVVYVARVGAASGAVAGHETCRSTRRPRRAPSCRASERSLDAAFAALSEQHFERSKLVVLGLANKDPQGAPARLTGRTSAGSRPTC